MSYLKINPAWLHIVAFFYIGFLAYASIANNLGSDFISYGLWFDGLELFGWQSCRGFEPGFCFLGLIFKLINLDYVVFMFSMVFAFYTLIYIFISKVVDEVGSLLGLLLLLAFSILILSPEMASHLTRQYLAAVIILFAALQNKSIIIYGLILLASAFHVTAIVFIVPLLLGGALQRWFVLVFTGLLLMYPAATILTYISDWLIGLSINHDMFRLVYNVVYKVNIYAGADRQLPLSKLMIILSAYLLAFLSIRKLDCENVSRFFRLFSLAVFLIFLTAEYSGLISARFYQYGKVFMFMTFVFILVGFLDKYMLIIKRKLAR